MFKLFFLYKKGVKCNKKTKYFILATHLVIILLVFHYLAYKKIIKRKTIFYFMNFQKILLII